MQVIRSISQQLRVFLTAATLLCVLVLNNREVATYTFPTTPVSKAENSQTLTSLPAGKTATVKQKVSFEAVNSYMLLHLAAVVDFLVPLFNRPVTFVEQAVQFFAEDFPFFSIFCASSIQPNGP